MQYKGHEYEITFCDPQDDWGEKRGMFYVETPAAKEGDESFFHTYAEAEKHAKTYIDRFLADVPQTKQDWLQAFEGCLVWTDYESCHLDQAMVWDLLLKAREHLKEE